MNEPSNARGHFASLWVKGGDIMIPTTITTQRKSKAREREAAKRAELVADLEKITGQKVRTVARSIDGVTRRWTGVKSNRSD
jgi:hypothetical protein